MLLLKENEVESPESKQGRESELVFLGKMMYKYNQLLIDPTIRSFNFLIGYLS